MGTSRLRGLGDRGEGGGEGVHRGEAVAGVLGEAAQEGFLDLGGDVGVGGDLAGRPRRALQVHRHQAHGVGVGEGDGAGEELVGDDAERVDVGAGVDGVAAGLLGGDVAGEDGGAVARVGADGAGELLDDGVVDDLDRLVFGLAADGEAVAGLEAAEHDALLVEAVDDLTEADEEAAGAAPREAAAAAEHGVEVVAVEVVADDEEFALEGHADVEDVDEVDEGGGVALLDRVVAVDAGADPRDEAGQLGERRHEHAHRDGLARDHVVGAKHRARRALPDEVGDLVAVGQERAGERGPRFPRRCARCARGARCGRCVGRFRLRPCERRHAAP